MACTEYYINHFNYTVSKIKVIVNKKNLDTGFFWSRYNMYYILSDIK